MQYYVKYIYDIKKMSIINLINLLTDMMSVCNKIKLLLKIKIDIWIIANIPHIEIQPKRNPLIKNLVAKRYLHKRAER